MKHVNRTNQVIFSILVCTLLAGILEVSAQSITSKDYYDYLAKRKTPANCEENSFILMGVNQEAGKQGMIIIISRLGKNERPELHNRRLHNAKTYLIDVLGRDSKTIITSQAESTEGFGRIEVYVGNFFKFLLIPLNRDLSVGKCVFDEDEDPCTNKSEIKLYPCVEKIRKKVRNK